MLDGKLVPQLCDKKLEAEVVGRGGEERVLLGETGGSFRPAVAGPRGMLA